MTEARSTKRIISRRAILAAGAGSAAAALLAACGDVVATTTAVAPTIAAAATQVAPAANAAVASAGPTIAAAVTSEGRTITIKARHFRLGPSTDVRQESRHRLGDGFYLTFESVPSSRNLGIVLQSCLIDA